MRILKAANIANSANTGMGRVMHRTAAALRAMGHEVELWFADDIQGQRLGRLERLTAPIALYRRLMRDREADRFDVLEIHEPLAAYCCLRRQLSTRLPPCVVMSHGAEGYAWHHVKELNRLLGAKASLKSRIAVPTTLVAPANLAMRLADQVMCLNPDEKRYLIKTVGVSANRVSVVDNAVDDRFFDEGRSRPLTPVPSQVRLLFVGTWLPKKGSWMLPRLFRSCAQRHSGVTMSLLGVGVDESVVRNAFSPDDRPAIDVRSHVDDQELREAYRSHHVLILGSFYEPFGLVLLEGAATGIAIASTDSGGPSRVFSHQQDALMSPIDDVAALERNVLTLIENPDLRFRLGDAARCRARQFTWSRAANSHLSVYERALRSERMQRSKSTPQNSDPPDSTAPKEGRLSSAVSSSDQAVVNSPEILSTAPR